LENLKRYDSIYEAGFTASGTETSQDIFFQLERKYKWRLAFDSGRCGYLMEILEYEKPKFQMPENGRKISLNADGWRVQSIRTKQWGYWGEDVSGNLYEDTVVKISPENDVVETGKMHDSALFGPQDVGPNIPKHAKLWSLGRFYSKLVDEVTHVEESANGCITVSALGKRGEGQPGRWELVIEPAAAWMVREACYYSDARPEIIACEMKNSGTAWNGSYYIPQKALFNYVGPIEGSKKLFLYELTFDPVIEQFDEKLYEGAKQAVTKDRPPKLTIHDHRMSPPLIFQPDKMSNIALDIAMSNDKLVDAGKAVADVRVTSPSTSPSVQSAPVSPVAQRPRYLLPVKWAVVVLILAVVIVGCACFFLFKSRRKS
jgi:hypothetical protein